MSFKPADTSREAQLVMIEGFRRMPGWQKLKCVSELTELLHSLALNEIRKKHPDADEQKLLLYLSSRWLPREVMKKAFDWDVQKEGY
jgi:hypothetical protein